MAKPIKKHMAYKNTHDWTSNFDSEPIGNIFYLDAEIFEISA